MPLRRLSFSAFLRPTLLLVLILAFGGSGCARLKGVFKDKTANEGVPVAELYEKGKRSIRNGNYD